MVSSLLTQKAFFSLLSLAEARGKLKKLALPLLLALKFKSAVILPIVFTLITLVSLKALKVGLVALLLAGKNYL
jgi:hypothetical protein